LVFSKPNYFKLTGPDGWVLSDGKTIYEYDSKGNSWTETPVSDEALKNFANRPSVWGWNSFFLKDALKGVAAAKAGAARTVKGNATTEVVETLAEEGKDPVTVYIDQKLGLVRSYRMKLGPDKELLVLASEIAASPEEVSADHFVFTAPAGAKKLEPAQAGAATYASVQAILNSSCMPCHNAQNKRDGIDLTNFQGVSAVVTPGNAPQSLLVKSLRGQGAKQMPLNRPPLAADKIKVIEDWINAGAKQ
jgi:outer membrane lipoprotein-sorting protein